MLPKLPKQTDNVVNGIDLVMQVYGKFAKSQNISMFIYQQCGKFPDKDYQYVKFYINEKCFPFCPTPLLHSMIIIPTSYPNMVSHKKNPDNRFDCRDHALIQSSP